MPNIGYVGLPAVLHLKDLRTGQIVGECPNDHHAFSAERGSIVIAELCESDEERAERLSHPETPGLSKSTMTRVAPRGGAPLPQGPSAFPPKT